MKHYISKLAIFLGALAVLSSTIEAQVFVHPEHLSGTIRFSNSNPLILDLLNAPGNEGMSNLIVLASSLPPAPALSANSDYTVPGSRTSGTYDMIVESSSAGIAYSAIPTVILEGQTFAYYFSNRTSAPVVTGTPSTLDFDECVGVVTVQFVDSGGAPVTVDGGQIVCVSLPDFSYSGIRSDIPGGVTEQRIYLRGDQTHQVQIQIHRGTSYYADRIESTLTTNVAVVCDDFTTVRMVIPDNGSLGKVIGTVEMLREFNNTIAGNTQFNYPDYTSVVADFGPFSNKRYGPVPGVNFTASASGPYTLTNVVPSTLDPTSVGYQVYAVMAFRTNRNIQLFYTPALGSGANAPLVVSPGASLDLGNTFVIDPGYMRGRVLLQGPAEGPGHPSEFRGVQHAGDNDVDHDGIPDYFGTYGVYWTALEAVGVDRLALGATYTASGGVAETDIGGDYDAVAHAFDGHYEMALGGLKGERSLWQVPYLNITLYGGDLTNENDYYNNILEITDNRTNNTEMVPTQAVTNDIAYCFSEVRIVFRSTTGTFYNPAIRQSPGDFAGTDFQGQPVDYHVDLESMYGTPISSATASNQGQITMFLPQGTYHLSPSVTAGSSDYYASTGLDPIDLTVGCGQRLTLEPCLQVSLDAPACLNTPLAHISGSVRSCSNAVASITYALDGGVPQIICSGCGQNPTFAFDVTLVGECADHSVTVTATDGSGGISSVTTTLHYDVTPPVIQCPSNLVASACDSNGVVVNFNVTATDNCAGPVTVISTPPSGSVFPPGITTVHCLAADACGNTNQCSFTVTVGGSVLTIERAIIIQWTCTGTLQGADDLTGPWLDIPGATSPYAVATSAARKFYRVRN
jgi:hypothetical protein